jgi:hypothetical protein
MASIFASQGRDDQAATVCSRAITLARELSLPYELCEAIELRADLLARGRDHEGALAACLEARALAERIEEQELAERMRLLELRLGVALVKQTAGAAGAALDALLDAEPDDMARAPIRAPSCAGATRR